MNGWYWLLWAVLTGVNLLVLIGTRHNLRATRRLLREHRSPQADA